MPGEVGGGQIARFCGCVRGVDQQAVALADQVEEGKVAGSVAAAQQTRRAVHSRVGVGEAVSLRRLEDGLFLVPQEDGAPPHAHQHGRDADDSFQDVVQGVGADHGLRHLQQGHRHVGFFLPLLQQPGIGHRRGGLVGDAADDGQGHVAEFPVAAQIGLVAAIVHQHGPQHLAVGGQGHQPGGLETAGCGRLFGQPQLGQRVGNEDGRLRGLQETEGRRTSQIEDPAVEEGLLFGGEAIGRGGHESLLGFIPQEQGASLHAAQHRRQPHDGLQHVVEGGLRLGGLGHLEQHRGDVGLLLRRLVEASVLDGHGGVAGESSGHRPRLRAIASRRVMGHGQQSQLAVARAQRGGDGRVVGREIQGRAQRLVGRLGGADGGLVRLQRLAEPGRVGRKIGHADLPRIAVNRSQTQVSLAQEPDGGHVTGKRAF